LIACVVYAAQAGWVKEMENVGLFQGDMVLTPAQQVEASEGKITYGSMRQGLWTKSGSTVTIPYDMDGHLRGSAVAQKALNAAFADYHKYTCLRFVPRRRNERAYIHFKTGGGCSSPVGMTGGRNDITLADACLGRGTTIHEIGHSIGLWHEQSRPDRDSYIKVRWENIQTHSEHNFKKQSLQKVDSRGTPYDYLSIMQYSKTAFGKDQRVTMQTIDPYFTDLIGAGPGFSDIDVEQINKMYNCHKYNGVVNARKMTPDCYDKYGACEMWVWDAGCSVWGSSCPFTCNRCSGGGPGTTNRPVPTNRPIPTNRPNPGGDCKDVAINCHELKDMCGWWADAKKMCGRTCNLC